MDGWMDGSQEKPPSSSLTLLDSRDSNSVFRVAVMSTRPRVLVCSNFCFSVCLWYGIGSCWGRFLTEASASAFLPSRTEWGHTSIPTNTPTRTGIRNHNSVHSRRRRFLHSVTPFQNHLGRWPSHNDRVTTRTGSQSLRTTRTNTHINNTVKNKTFVSNVINISNSTNRNLEILVTPVPSLDNGKLHTRTTGYNSRQKGRRRKENQHRWLNWLYHQWSTTPVGQLEHAVLKQMGPAMAHYAKRKSQRSADRAHAVLQRYIQEHQAGNVHAPLHTALFNTAMDAYAQLGQPEPAQQILKQMLLLARQSTATGAVTTRHRALQPDAVSLATIATAWAKSHRVEAVPKTLALLTYMEQQNLATSNHAYNIALAAIVASPEHNSSNRGNCHKAAPAQAILERMQQRAAQGYPNCAPDLYTYQTYMTALSHTRQRDTPDIVMAVLEFLTTQSDPTSPATTRAHLAPNAHCYTAAIHAWAYSKAPHKARNAYDLLQTMRRRHEVDGRLDCRPNVVVFTAVLNACVKPLPDDRETAFGLAQLVYEELLLSGYGPPNFLTYATFLHAIQTCLDDDDPRRDVAVRRLFADCRDFGHVGHIVLDRLRIVASTSLYEELLERHERHIIPWSWSRNVKGERIRK